jgi:hypothetical protein
MVALPSSPVAASSGFIPLLKSVANEKTVVSRRKTTLANDDTQSLNTFIDENLGQKKNLTKAVVQGHASNLLR